MRPPPPPPPPPKKTAPNESEIDDFLSAALGNEPSKASAQYNFDDEYFEAMQAEIQKQTIEPPSAASAVQTQVVKKTPFQLKKEAEEAKRRRDELEAEEALKQFTASFESGMDPSPAETRAKGFVAKTWVKGASIVPTSVGTIEEQARSHEDASTDAFYRPHAKFTSSLPPQPPSPPTPLPANRDAPPKPSTVASRKRNLDAFLQELKSHHDSPAAAAVAAVTSAASAAYLRPPVGSHDTGDPTSTNLYLGNLSPISNEESILHAFGPFGPIASVKIMWPRNQEELSRGRNTGFIGFMKRADAEKALKAMDGEKLDGHELRVGWSKAIPIPAKPIFDLNPPPVPTNLPFNAQYPPPQLGAKAKKKKPVPAEVKVQIPSDFATLRRIHHVVTYVLLHGPSFEARLIAKEQANQDYTFLTDFTSPLHHYYRWKCYSLANGDDLDDWRETPFRMFDDGIVWIPPRVAYHEPPSRSASGTPAVSGDEAPFAPYVESDEDRDASDSSSSSRSSVSSSRDRRVSRRRRSGSHTNRDSRRSGRRRSKKKGGWNETDRRELIQGLSTLTPSRAQIGSWMVFALRKAGHGGAAEIARLMTESVVFPGILDSSVGAAKRGQGHLMTGDSNREDAVLMEKESLLLEVVQKKLARLFLVSDVIHNCGVIGDKTRDAWKFRTEFPSLLESYGVFHHLGGLWRQITARLRAEVFRRGVMGVLDSWSKASLVQESMISLFRGAWKDGCEGSTGEENAGGNGLGGGEKEDIGKGEEVVAVDAERDEQGKEQRTPRERKSRFAPIETKSTDVEAHSDEYGGRKDVASKFKPIASTQPDRMESKPMHGFVPIAGAPKFVAAGSGETRTAVSISKVVDEAKKDMLDGGGKRSGGRKVVAGAASVFQQDSDSE